MYGNGAVTGMECILPEHIAIQLVPQMVPPVFCEVAAGILMKIIVLLVYFALLVGIGFYCRKNATDGNGVVLGGRSVGPWLTAFAYGTSYFSAVVFVGYAGQFGWKYGIAATWAGLGNAVIGQQRTQTLCFHNNICILDSVYGIFVQRTLQIICHGI